MCFGDFPPLLSFDVRLAVPAYKMSGTFVALWTLACSGFVLVNLTSSRARRNIDTAEARIGIRDTEVFLHSPICAREIGESSDSCLAMWSRRILRRHIRFELAGLQ